MKRMALLIGLLIFGMSAQNAAAECNTTIAPAEGETSVTLANETWTPAGSPYCIDCNIIVEGLTIEPGVRVEFNGDYEMDVSGVLSAAGTEAQPIVITKTDTVNGWQGIVFDNAPDGSEMIHCRVEHATKSGIRIVNSSLTLENCSILNNSTEVDGGGMDIELNLPNDLEISHCQINNNEAEENGGGLAVAVTTGSLILNHCTINDNRITFDDNYDAHGGGIYCSSATGQLKLVDCEINGNFDSGGFIRSEGGGLYVDHGNMLLENCIISSNECHSSVGGGIIPHTHGGGIYQDRGLLEAFNCIISSNTLNQLTQGNEKGGGIYTPHATVILENTTIAYNTHEGLYNADDAVISVLNSIIYHNYGDAVFGSITANYSDIEGRESEDGEEGNIDCEPGFQSPMNLLSFQSTTPCIMDAGSPEAKYNDQCFLPDGVSLGTERNDMGATGGSRACRWKMEQYLINGDINHDGQLDINDAIQIIQYITGQISSL